jgi:hypothetical protein
MGFGIEDVRHSNKVPAPEGRNFNSRRNVFDQPSSSNSTVAAQALRRPGQEPRQDRQERRPRRPLPLLSRLGDGERTPPGARRRFDGSKNASRQGARRGRDGRGGGASGLSCDAPRAAGSQRAARAATRRLQRLCASAPAPRLIGSVPAVSRSTGRWSLPCCRAPRDTTRGRRKPRRSATVSRLCRSFATCARGRSRAGPATRLFRRQLRSGKARARTLTPPSLARRPDRGTTRPLPPPSCSGISC